MGSDDSADSEAVEPGVKSEDESGDKPEGEAAGEGAEMNSSIDRASRPGPPMRLAFASWSGRGKAKEAAVAAVRRMRVGGGGGDAREDDGLGRVGDEGMGRGEARVGGVEGEGDGGEAGRVNVEGEDAGELDEEGLESGAIATVGSEGGGAARGAVSLEDSVGIGSSRD